MDNKEPSQKHWELWGLIESFRHGKRKEAFPSVSLLAERLGCCARTVRRRLSDLQAYGLITALPRFAEGGRQTSNLYITQTMRQASLAARPVRPSPALQENPQPLPAPKPASTLPAEACQREADKINHVTASLPKHSVCDDDQALADGARNECTAHIMSSSDDPPPSLITLLKKQGATLSIRAGSLDQEWLDTIAASGVRTPHDFSVAVSAIVREGGNLRGAMPSRWRSFKTAITSALQEAREAERAALEQRKQQIDAIRRQMAVEEAKRTLTGRGVSEDLTEQVVAREGRIETADQVITSVQREVERSRIRAVIQDIYHRVGGTGEWKPSAKKTDTLVWCLSNKIARGEVVDQRSDWIKVAPSTGLDVACLTMSERMLMSMTGSLPSTIMESVVHRLRPPIDSCR